MVRLCQKIIISIRNILWGCGIIVEYHVSLQIRFNPSGADAGFVTLIVSLSTHQEVMLE